MDRRLVTVNEALKNAVCDKKIYIVDGAKFRIAMVDHLNGMPYAAFNNDVIWADGERCPSVLVVMGDVVDFMSRHSETETKAFLRVVIGHEIGHLVDSLTNPFKPGFVNSIDREVVADAWAIDHCGDLKSYQCMMTELISTIDKLNRQYYVAPLCAAFGILNGASLRKRMRLAKKASGKKGGKRFDDIDEIVDIVIEVAKQRYC